MRPHLYSPTFVEDQDAVCPDDTGKTVSDDERRPVLHQMVERHLDDRLILGIDTGERLVQQQN